MHFWNALVTEIERAGRAAIRTPEGERVADAVVNDVANSLIEQIPAPYHGVAKAVAAHVVGKLEAKLNATGGRDAAD